MHPKSASEGYGMSDRNLQTYATCSHKIFIEIHLFLTLGSGLFEDIMFAFDIDSSS